MTLEQWQSRLAECLSGRGEPGTDPWWQRTASSQGLSLTRRISHSWAVHRLRQAAGLSLRALDEARQEALLTRWLEAGFGNAPSLEEEVDRLRQDTLAMAPDPSHARSICSLEIALACAVREQDRGWGGQHVRAGPTKIPFHGPPLEILIAVTKGFLPPLEPAVTWVGIWPEAPDRWSIERPV